MSFLEGATGDPAGSSVRITSHALADILDFANTERDACSNGVDATIAGELIEALKISVGGEPAARIQGKKAVNDFTFDAGDVDATNYAIYHILANVFGKYRNTDQTTYREWEFSTEEATSADPYLAIALDSNVVPRTQLFNVQAQGFEMSAAPNENFTFTSPMVAGQYHRWGIPTQTTGSASTLPTVLGPYLEVWDGTNTDQLVVEIQAVASEVLTIRAAFGVTAHAGSGVTYTMGDPPVRLVDETDTPIGVFSQPIMFACPAGSTFTATDTFDYAIRRPAWTQSLPTRRVLGSVNTQVYINDVQRSVEGGWSVSTQWENLVLDNDTSRVYGGLPVRSGELQTTVQLTRSLRDLVLQEAQDRGTVLPLVFDAQSDVDISGASRPFMFRTVLPACQIIGDSYGVEPGGTNRTEVLTLQASEPAAAYTSFPGGGSYAKSIHVWVESDVASL